MVLQQQVTPPENTCLYNYNNLFFIPMFWFIYEFRLIRLETNRLNKNIDLLKDIASSVDYKLSTLVSKDDENFSIVDRIKLLLTKVNNIINPISDQKPISE